MGNWEGRCTVASKGTAGTALRITAGDDVLVAVDFMPRSTPNGDQTLGRSGIGCEVVGAEAGDSACNEAFVGACLDIGDAWLETGCRFAGTVWLADA